MTKKEEKSIKKNIESKRDDRLYEKLKLMELQELESFFIIFTFQAKLFVIV